jgi:hypothetical protein
MWPGEMFTSDRHLVGEVALNLPNRENNHLRSRSPAIEGGENSLLNPKGLIPVGRSSKGGLGERGA